MIFLASYKTKGTAGQAVLFANFMFVELIIRIK